MEDLNADIKEIISQVPYGEIVLQIKTANGRPMQLIAPSYNHIRFKSNAEAGAHILSYLAELSKRGYNGSYTFTVNYKTGRIKEVIFEGLEQRNYGTKKDLRK